MMHNGIHRNRIDVAFVSPVDLMHIVARRQSSRRIAPLHKLHDLVQLDMADGVGAVGKARKSSRARLPLQLLCYAALQDLEQGVSLLYAALRKPREPVTWLPRRLYEGLTA
jgi:hypothetical protein